MEDIGPGTFLTQAKEELTEYFIDDAWESNLVKSSLSFIFTIMLIYVKFLTVMCVVAMTFQQFKGFDNQISARFSENIQDKNDTIIWSSTRRLTYDDFKGIPRPAANSNGDTLAICAYTVKYKIKILAKYLKIEAFAVFERNNSWMKRKAVWVLDHEQGHFDIAEIYALQFEKKVNDTSIEGFHEFVDFLNTSFKETAKECNEEQERYDIQMMNTLGRQYYFKWIKEQLDSVTKGR